MKFYAWESNKIQKLTFIYFYLLKKFGYVTKLTVSKQTSMVYLSKTSKIFSYLMALIGNTESKSEENPDLLLLLGHNIL